MRQRRGKAISLPRKLLFSALLCAVVLVVLEGSLAILGVVPLNQRRDSFVGFAGNVRLFVKENERFVTNPVKLSYFNRQSFASKKPAGTTRVFCLGGSTTFGHPYDDSTSFSGWLRRMLAHVEPGHFEVINCGGVSYASYRIALMMEELVQYEPDLFIIYCGHNEFLEQRTYPNQRDPGVLMKLQQAVSNLRTSGLFDTLAGRSSRNEKQENRLAAEVDVILDRTNGPETYHRDPVQRAGVIAHYNESIRRIVSSARTAGAKVILVKPESNLRHFSPFKSERSLLPFAESMRWEKFIVDARRARSAGDLAKAASLFETACSLDPLDAATLFETGSALLDLGRTSDANNYLLRARDEDVCPLRAPSEIMDAVVRLADELHIPLVDYSNIISERTLQLTKQPIPGDECFLDHVHPTIEANGDLAEALFSMMQTMDLLPRDHKCADARTAVVESLMKSVDSRQQSLAMTRVAQVLSWAGKDQEGLKSAKLAVDLSPDCSEAVSQYGRMLEKTGAGDAALPQYEKAVELNGDDSLARSRLASALFLREQYKEAKEHWLKAIQTTPPSAPLSFRVELHVRVGDCDSLLGDKAAAEKHYLNARALDPQSSLVWKRLSP